MLAGKVDITTAAAASVIKRRSNPGVPIASIMLFGQTGQQAFIVLKDSKIKTIGDWEGGNRVRFRDVTLDDNQNVYVTGSFEGTVDFDPGDGITELTATFNQDICFAKYNFNGELIWAKGLSGTWNGSEYMRKNVFKIGVSSRGINEPRVSRNTAMLLSFRRNILGLSGLGIIFCLLIAAVVGPVIAPFDPYAQDLSSRLAPPGTIYWLGADELGRDILSRLLHGARTTLLIVLLVVVISAPIGLVFGCTAGYIGGWLDLLLMRLTDVFLAFPRLILALALVAALGPGLENAIIAIASRLQIKVRLHLQSRRRRWKFSLLTIAPLKNFS